MFIFEYLKNLIASRGLWIEGKFFQGVRIFLSFITGLLPVICGFVVLPKTELHCQTSFKMILK